MLITSGVKDTRRGGHEPQPVPIADEHRRDMVVWAEPIIADCIARAYRACGISAPYQSLLTIHHRRLWRALLLQNSEHIDAVRSDLVRDAARAGIAPDRLDDVDHDVLEELMDIVLKRFRDSRARAKGCGLVLLGAAASLGPTSRRTQ